jgi:hypothetical protein
MQITLHFASFSDKIAFNLRNGIMPCDLIAEGPGWQTMRDDGIQYENSPFVYSVERI